MQGLAVDSGVFPAGVVDQRAGIECIEDLLVAPSRPSTITRSRGSVPEGRSSTRPAIAERLLRIRLRTVAMPPSARQSKPAGMRTLISVCG
jgi:hypothetical protein